MKKYQTHRSSLFLMELIIAIVFFALASSVCLQLFVKSHSLSCKTKELNTAATLCSSAAEAVRQCEGSEKLLLQFLPQLSLNQDSGFIAYYNKDFINCSFDDSSYILEITMNQKGSLLSGQIQFLTSKEKQILYELPVKVHIPFSVKGGVNES